MWSESGARIDFQCLTAFGAIKCENLETIQIHIFRVCPGERRHLGTAGQRLWESWGWQRKPSNQTTYAQKAMLIRSTPTPEG
jgi:hypothetical protein